MYKRQAHAIGQAAVNSLRRYGVDTSRITRGGDRVGCLLYTSEISERQNLSLKYLEQIVTPLARVGLVKSCL